MAVTTETRWNAEAISYELGLVPLEDVTQIRDLATGKQVMVADSAGIHVGVVTEKATAERQKCTFEIYMDSMLLHTRTYHRNALGDWPTEPTSSEFHFEEGATIYV